MKDIHKALKVVSISVLVAVLAIVSYIAGYDYGYSVAMDKYLDASECKPSRKWRQRF